MKNTLRVEGMSCNHCKMRVEKAVSEVDGVKDAQVSLEDKKVEFEADPSLISQVKDVIKEVGYEVVE